MTDKEYKYIATIAECGNITKAAEKLFIAQPSLTQSLHRIEEDYGASFFYRCHDGVRLTEAGENYMAAANKMLEAYEELKKNLNNDRSDQIGKIQIGLESGQADCILTGFLKNYKRRYPNVDLRIIELPSIQLQKMAVDTSLDIALLHYPFVNEKLAYVPIAEDELVLAVSPAVLSEKKKESAEILTVDRTFMQQQSFLMPTSDQQLRTVAENICSLAEIEPDIKYTAMNLPTLLALAAEGLGAAIVPLSLYKRYSAVYPLVYMTFPTDWNAEWKLVAAYREDAGIGELSRELIGVFRESMGGVE